MTQLTPITLPMAYAWRRQEERFQLMQTAINYSTFHSFKMLYTMDWFNFVPVVFINRELISKN